MHQDQTGHLLISNYVPFILIGDDIVAPPPFALSPSAKNIAPRVANSIGLNKLIARYCVLRFCICNASSYKNSKELQIQK